MAKNDVNELPGAGGNDVLKQTNIYYNKDKCCDIDLVKHMPVDKVSELPKDVKENDSHIKELANHMRDVLSGITNKGE